MWRKTKEQWQLRFYADTHRQKVISHNRRRPFRYGARPVLLACNIPAELPWQTEPRRLEVIARAAAAC